MDTRLDNNMTSENVICGVVEGRNYEVVDVSSLEIGTKIKIFISSICGNPKKPQYDKVRAELKDAIEKTGLAYVYLFEGKGAATISAGNHYSWELEDSDVCIFLIDNADGIPSGVQAEIDIVRKYNIKALYYFCDERQKKKTPLQLGLMGAQYAKSKTVHNFEELSRDGASDLINDILNIYHHYCKGRIAERIEEGNVQGVDVTSVEKHPVVTIPKTAIQNIDKCKAYILRLLVDKTYTIKSGEEKTGEIDNWCAEFLPIMFEGKSIRHFNVGVYLNVLKEQQSEEYFKVINIRWQAIQEYYMGNVEKCKELLEKALACAKENNQPTWLTKDILIDIRNIHWTLCTIKNQYFEPEAQKELSESGEDVYYPILDRINESMHEKYIEGLYKKKIESPYTVTFGGNLELYGKQLASYFVIAMYNGSLTQILLFYEKIRNILFYLCCKYDDWNLRRDLFKFAIYFGKDKDITGIQESYPEVLNNLTSKDAESIMEFCSNHVIMYERFNSQLLAFGAVGYYLDESSFEKYEKLILEEIKEWINSDILIPNPAQSIFKGLAGVSHRMSQTELVEICCLFIQKRYSRWYTDLFTFIAKNIDLRKMDKEIAEKLIHHLLSIFEIEQDREQIKYAPAFLYVLRKQDKLLTMELDKKTEECLPNFYNGVYKLETAETSIEGTHDFLKKYAEQIRMNNETQGKGGVYHGRVTREIATIRNILLEEDYLCESAIMDEIISSTADTLLHSKESVSIKLDAVSLLCCIAVKYPEEYKRNKKVYDELYEKRDEIDSSNHSIISSNIDTIALKIGLQFLFTSMEIDIYPEILGLMPYIQNDVATTLAVVRVIIEYLECSDSVVLPSKIESIIFQNVLQWIHSDNMNIRWIATRILLMLLRNVENQPIINQQLVGIIDSDCYYIKNLILRHIFNTDGITETTRNYILSKCENDANYVVRMVCEEEKEKSK